MNKKSKYEVGEILIARPWIRQPRVNKNIRYRIVDIGHDNLGAQITLQNIENDKDKFMFFEAVVDNNFIYSHSATRHSS